MAPLPPVADVVKLTLGFKVGNNTGVECITHFTYAGTAPSSADCVTLAGLAQAAAITNLGPYLSSGFSFELFTVQDMASDTGAAGVGGTVTAGGRAGNVLGANTAIVVQNHVARRYRGGHPRNYLPLGVQGDLATSGQWLGAFVSQVANHWIDFYTAFVGQVGGGATIEEFVAVSYYLNKALRTTPLVMPIVTATARTQLGTQRRRVKKA